VTRLHTAAAGGFFALLGAIGAVVAIALLIAPFSFTLWYHQGFARACAVGLVIAAVAGADVAVRRAMKHGVVGIEVSSAGAAIGVASGMVAGVLIGFSHRLVAVLPYSLYSGWSKYVVFPALGGFFAGTLAALVVPPVRSLFVLAPGLATLVLLVLALTGPEPARAPVTPEQARSQSSGPAPPLGRADYAIEPPPYVPVPASTAAEPSPPHRNVVIGDMGVGVAGPGPTIVAMRTGAITAYGLDDGVRWAIGGLDAERAVAGPAGDTLVALRNGSLVALAPIGRVRWVYDPRRPLQVLGAATDGRVRVYTTPDTAVAGKTASVRAIDASGRATDVLTVTTARASDIGMAEDGSLIVRAGDRLSMHEATGAVRWTATTTKADVPESGFEGIPPVPLAGGAAIASPRTLRAYDAQGHVRWSMTTRFRDGRDIVRAIVGTSAGRIYAQSSAVTAIEDGRELWRWDKAPLVGRPVVGPDGTVYVRDTHGVVYALSPEGRLRWMWRPDGNQRTANARDGEKLWLAGDRLVVEQSSGVAILDLRERRVPGATTP
jgi:outer membrane protein assembly factor BamB